MTGHPCETCLRWWECNGVEASTCCPQTKTEESDPNDDKGRSEEPAAPRGR